MEFKLIKILFTVIVVSILTPQVNANKDPDPEPSFGTCDSAINTQKSLEITYDSENYVVIGERTVHLQILIYNPGTNNEHYVLFNPTNLEIFNFSNLQIPTNESYDNIKLKTAGVRLQELYNQVQDKESLLGNLHNEIQPELEILVSNFLQYLSRNSVSIDDLNHPLSLVESPNEYLGLDEISSNIKSTIVLSSPFKLQSQEASMNFVDGILARTLKVDPEYPLDIFEESTSNLITDRMNILNAYLFDVLHGPLNIKEIQESMLMKNFLFLTLEGINRALYRIDHLNENDFNDMTFEKLHRLFSDIYSKFEPNLNSFQKKSILDNEVNSLKSNIFKYQNVEAAINKLQDVLNKFDNVLLTTDQINKKEGMEFLLGKLEFISYLIDKDNYMNFQGEESNYTQASGVVQTNQSDDKVLFPFVIGFETYFPFIHYLSQYEITSVFDINNSALN